MNRNKNYNGMIALGITATIIGIIMLMYSFVSYSEKKLLSDKIDFDSIDNNNQISTSEKYYKYSSILDILITKLEKNKNLPYKNMSCAYLDYAQHDIKSMYKIVYKGANDELSKRETVKKNIEKLSDIYKYYKNCKTTALYTQELENMLKESKNIGNVLPNERMENFLNGNKFFDNSENQNLQEKETNFEESHQYGDSQNMHLSSDESTADSDASLYNEITPYLEHNNKQN